MNHKKTYEELLQTCTEKVSIEQLYADLWTDGMQFGPLFKLLSEMKAGFNSGVATLTIPDTASVMLCKFEHPLLIHPAVLDGIFQFGYCNIHCGRQDANMIVIASVEHLYVSADVPNTSGTVLRGYENAELLGPRDILTNIVVSDPEFTKPLVTCKNIRSTYLTDSNAKRQTSKSQLATRFVWKEDISMGSPTLAKSLAATSLCLEKEMCSTLNLLEQAARIYIKRAANHLDARERRETAQQLSLDFLNRDIALTTASGLGDDELLTTAAASSPLGKVLQAFGDKINDIIDGDIDPYGILRSQGFENHDRFNDTLFLKNLINYKVATWFDILGNINPNLRILNIGSGSVSTSTAILDTLSGKKNAGPRYSKYIFSQTDNTSRLAAINELSERYPNVDVLTTSNDGGLDKQKPDSKYDVVIIEDVMRGVTKIESAIQSATRLLKPGGKLVVLELTNLTFRAGLLFSLTGQWTMSPESNANTSREHSQAHERWTKLLNNNGMSPPDALVPDFSHDELHQMSLIISTYPKSSAHSKQTIVLLESTLRSTSTATILSCNLWKLLTKQGFEIIKATISSMPDPENKIFISMIDIDTPFLDSMSETKFVNFKILTTKSAGVLWLTRAGMKDGPCLPNHFSASGLFRVIRAENPHLRLFNLDLSTDIALESIETCNLVMKVFQQSFIGDPGPVVEHEYAEAGGALFAPRLIQEEEMNSSLTAKTEVPTPQMEKLFQPGRPLKMIIGEVGLLDTFRFVDREEYTKPLEPEEVDVQILATGLNFVDIMASLGYIPSPALGAEFSGTITHVGSQVPSDKFHVGQVVVGIGEHCYASNFRLNWRAIEPVPKGVDPETAATCIIAYATAYFALYENSRLKKGQTILIHYGAGGLGQAAVQLAQHIGAVVYCTVGSLEKKKLMMERYGIPENRIFNSRDTTFAKGLMRETNGRGVDVILNSTFGEMLRVTWNCLADFGVMVEVGKRDILSNNMLEMAPFIRGCTFSAVNLAMYPNDCELDRLEVYREVVKKVLKLFEEGHVTSPYPLTVMSVTQAEDAFRSLQSGKLAGKIVLRMDPDAVVPVMPRKEPPLQLDPNATYLLAGGLGGIGRSLSDLMVKHGARNIAFISRSGGVSAEAKSYLEQLRNQGVNVIAYACDIADRETLELTLQKCVTEMPKIKGFIHAAMLLKVCTQLYSSHEI
jgi:NADPH:quinone reductase-like Zn-dependent oxidoreductase/SAM-dependent methyltransferase